MKPNIINENEFSFDIPTTYIDNNRPIRNSIGHWLLNWIKENINSEFYLNYLSRDIDKRISIAVQRYIVDNGIIKAVFKISEVK